MASLDRLKRKLAHALGTQFWKYGPTPDNATDHWVQIPVGDDNGDNILTIHVTDGGKGDDDLLANTQIHDQGGPGTPVASSLPVGGYDVPVNELAILAPYLTWAGLFGVGVVVGVLAIRKKREN